MINYQYTINQSNGWNPRQGGSNNSWYNMSAPNGCYDTIRRDSENYGYKDYLSFNDYYSMYRRVGFASALVDIIPERCFSEFPKIIDGNKNDTTSDVETKFEQDIAAIDEKFGLMRIFREAEKMAAVGTYSAIVPVFAESESTALDAPISRVNGLGNNVENIIAIRVYYEVECEAATEFVSDFFDADYDKPRYYTIYPDAISDRNQSTNNQSFNIHRSRVFIVSNAINGIFGEPALESAFNSLFDTNKIRGAAAEGYRKNARQRTILNANNADAAKAFATKKEAIDKSIDDFENSGFNNMLKLAGVDAQTLQSSITDPTGAHTIAMQEACASRRVPVTELIGFMTGERSSTENSSAFSKRLRSEQNNEYGPRMVKFLNWLVNIGAVTPPSSGVITVDWPEIAEPSRGEKLDNSSKMVDQNDKAYKSNEESPWTVEEIREVAGFDTEKPETEYDIEPKQDLSIEDENTENPSAEEE